MAGALRSQPSTIAEVIKPRPPSRCAGTRMGKIPAITRAVIPAAGLGTRLLTATKEQPKEMLPVFAPVRAGLCLKPVVQMIFEQLYDCGFREFCFVVGRGKRAIEDHFTPDKGFVRMLQSQGKKDLAQDLNSFYSKVVGSTIFWLNQAEPRGFGDAVLSARAFGDGKPLLVHAGDNHVISRNNSHIKRLLKEHRRSDGKATLLLRKIEDPRNYGVAEFKNMGGMIQVTRLVEKPDRPASKWALLPTYVFEDEIFDALASIKPGKGGEYQLTDAIQLLIDRALKVTAVKVQRHEFWLDVGNPEAYWRALGESHQAFAKRV